METESIQDKACLLNEGVCVYQGAIETEAKMKRAEASLNEVSSGVQGCITGNTVPLAIWACPWPRRKAVGGTRRLRVTCPVWALTQCQCSL